MQYIICYDVSEDKIRREVVKFLESFAYRLQGSVFISDKDSLSMHKIQQHLLKITKTSDKCKLLIAPLGWGSVKDIWTNDETMKKSQYYIIS